MATRQPPHDEHIGWAHTARQEVDGLSSAFRWHRVRGDGGDGDEASFRNLALLGPVDMVGLFVMYCRPGSAPSHQGPQFGSADWGP